MLGNNKTEGMRSAGDDRGDNPTPTAPSSSLDLVVVAIAVGAAVVGALAEGEPTGTGPWDGVLKAAVAGGFVMSIVHAPRWVSIITATVAAAFVGQMPWLAVAVVGLIVAIGASMPRRRISIVEALSAALAAQALLRLDPIGFFGLPSIIAGATVAFAALLAWPRASARTRKLTIRTALVIAGLAIVACAVGGLTLLGARGDVEAGVEAAQGSLDAARGGEPTELVERLGRASEAFGRAEDRADSLATQPLRLIPVAAQHRQAIVVATRQGRALANQASRAAIDADISDISMSAGSVNLGSLSAMQDDLARTVELLETADAEITAARSPWLVPPVGERMDELGDEVRTVLPEARIAADAAAVVPAMLGDPEPRRYFVGFGSPAESRDLGGYIGSWALLEFDSGDISLIEAGRIRSLYELARSNGPLDIDSFPTWYAARVRPDHWPQNITTSADISVVAQAARHIFDGIADGPIDGFIYLDGYVLSALLEISGPISLEGVEGRIRPGNANDFFFDGQYRIEDRETLKADMNDMFAQVFEGLVDKRLPGPERLGRILGPAARQGRLQVATFDDEENAFLQSIRLQRSFPPRQGTMDSFAVVHANGSINKLDLYMHRDVVYDVTVDDSGGLEARVAVELNLSVPDDAPAYTLGKDNPGIGATHLSLYTPHELSRVTVDGEPVDNLTTGEFGYWRYEVQIPMESGQTSLVEYELSGQIEATGDDYQVGVWQQALVHNDQVEVRYTDATAQIHTVEVELVEPIVVSFADSDDFEPAIALVAAETVD